MCAYGLPTTFSMPFKSLNFYNETTTWTDRPTAVFYIHDILALLIVRSIFPLFSSSLFVDNEMDGFGNRIALYFTLPTHSLTFRSGQNSARLIVMAMMMM